MDAPTHLDAFRALLASCLPCTNRPPALPPSPTLRPRGSNDLDALLRPPSSDLENDTDAMSLHSTFGSDARARRKKKKNGMPQLCGLNLFGKPRIALESDDEGDQPRQRAQSADIAPPRVRPRYDSDAAPLPDATISSLAAGTQRHQEQPLRLEESPEEELARLRAEKAARKARRRDRRERKAAKQLALEAAGGEFEGYPGSGPGTDLPISPPSTTTSTPGVDDADPEDGEADMGAAAYTRSNGRSSVFSGSSSGTGTSRTGRSRSGSNALGLGLHKGPPSPLGQTYVSAPPPPPPPVLVDVSSKEDMLISSKDEPKDQSTPSPRSEPAASPKDESSPSSKGKEVSDTRAPRPKIHISNLVSNNLPMSSPGAGPGPRTMESSPRIVAANGFPSPRITNSNNGFPSPRIGAGSGFPSPGLGLTGAGFPSPRIGAGGSGGTGGMAGFPFGPARKGSVTAGMGVALANRGD